MSTPHPGLGPLASPADLRSAGDWLTRHDLIGTRVTPVLASRLAVRRRARLGTHIMLAALIMGSSLVAALSGFRPQPLPMLALAALVAGLLVGQSLLDWWVRRVDQRAGATLSRRAAHSIQPGWQEVLGRPYAAFVAATVAGAMALAGSALGVPDPTVRHMAVVLLICLLGGSAVMVLQLRHLLRRPVVAEDEESLTADVIMRIEDARELTMPSVQWSLPMVLVFGFAPAWWGAAAVAYVLVGLGAFVAIQRRMPSSAVAARQAMGAR
ncbi:hypothetical protein [Nonomuraea soli]|uniref:Uncharacterized protein n=1 Tax=Nonomuraea soli TaxID=1032476 RepID=A0A7W0HNW8_9ACTN|nr:hypothetical protein [Nonomuraea soli]MBA2890230.1 hypothetical protein [Nonomuraea soli]